MATFIIATIFVCRYPSVRLAIAILAMLLYAAIACNEFFDLFTIYIAICSYIFEWQYFYLYVHTYVTYLYMRIV